jgi:rare lipoprotein A
MKITTYLLIVSFVFLMAYLLHSKEKTIAACTASWYGNECRGHIMANGEAFDPDAMTCASWYYPLGTRLLVTHDDKSVEVLVTDRGPARQLLSTRQLDLSAAAFKQLEDTNKGLVHVFVSRLSL